MEACIYLDSCTPKYEIPKIIICIPIATLNNIFFISSFFIFKIMFSIIPILMLIIAIYNMVFEETSNAEVVVFCILFINFGENIPIINNNNIITIIFIN